MARLPLSVEPVPLDLAWNDPAANLKAIEAEVRARLEASPETPPESRLFLFPELTLTGFVTKEPASFSVDDGPAGALRALARSLGVGIAAGFPERNPADPSRPFNALAVIDPAGKVAGLYRKTHLFTLGANPESAAYTAGARGTVFDYRGWKVGLAVCFDVRFSALFHAYAKAGVDLLLISSCWVGGPHKTEQYRTLCAAHAILTQAYAAAVNRSGRDPAWEYDGSAYIFAPNGESLSMESLSPLDPARLEAARALKVRVADRPDYPVVP
ncbi:MAG: carbon-nitrogen hydrolase family protein [Elusimicrobia bacterium]|nr:carbon-nitrogen hydrolase family protein [Elusimicrobiota bacterium]